MLVIYDLQNQKLIKNHSFLILSFILSLLEHLDQAEKNIVKELQPGAINSGSASNDAARV